MLSVVSSYVLCVYMNVSIYMILNILAFQILQSEMLLIAANSDASVKHQKSVNLSVKY